MNLNGKQIIAIIAAVLSVLMISTAQLTDLFGAGVAKTIVSVAGLANTVINSVLAVITSQSAQVQSVLDMPGVSRIGVNADANKTLAAMAMDPAVNNIAPIKGAEAAVQSTAQAA
jgi:hypothetical protein